jgi:hypothetical protein
MQTYKVISWFLTRFAFQMGQPTCTTTAWGPVVAEAFPAIIAAEMSRPQREGEDSGGAGAGAGGGGGGGGGVSSNGGAVQVECSCDPWLESAWFQPLRLQSEKPVSSLCFQIQLVPLQNGNGSGSGGGPEPIGEELKAKGNAEFKGGNFKEAVKLYTSALDKGGTAGTASKKWRAVVVGGCTSTSQMQLTHSLKPPGCNP